MSEMATKKTKWTKRGPRRWEMGDYAVEATNRGPTVVFTATVRAPAGAETIGAAQADGTKGSLAKARKRAQQCCEEHLAGAETEPEPTPEEQSAEPETPLQWEPQTDEDVDGPPAATIWVATLPDGTAYSVEEDEIPGRDGEKGWYCQHGGVDIDPPQPSKEAGWALCEWHQSTTLVWEPEEAMDDPGVEHLAAADGYRCVPGPVEGWVAWQENTPLGSFATDVLAMEHCQDHHRERNPPPTPAKAPPGADIAARKPGQLPAPQRADWTIPMPLTEEEMAAAFIEGRELRRKKWRLQAEVAAAHEAYKKLASRNKELVEELEEEIRGLDEHMPQKPVDCFQAYYRDEQGDVWVEYLQPHESGGPSSLSLHQRKLDKGEQRQLFGEGDPPPDKPPAAKTEPPPAEPEPEANPRLLLPVDRDLSRRTEWDPIKEGKPARVVYIAGDIEGEHYRAEKVSTGLHCVTFIAAGGHERELPGTHTRLKDAFAEAHADNQTRLRWPPLEPGQRVLGCGPYQLACASTIPGDPEADNWGIAYVAPGLDEETVSLGVRHGLTAAQDACQAHAAELRAREAAA